MKRIDTSTRAQNLFGLGKDGFKDGDLANGLLPTDLDASFFNAIQEEIAAVIESAGISLDGAKFSQLWQAIRKQVGAQNLVCFLSNTSWTVPANVFRIKARVWGAGGGGGGTSNGAAAGGAGGGYSEGWFAVTPGQVLAISVGAGGLRGSGAPTAGAFGGTTSIGSLLAATGGAGGAGAGGGGAAPVTGTTGEGFGGQFNLRGNPTNAGIIVGGTPLGSAGGGTFCTSIVGGFSNSTGNGAGFPGGGGGGAGGSTFAEGAVGAGGLAIIEW